MSPTLSGLPRHTHYDAIVVGARAAGASTALLLARAGLSVLVVDRGRYGADTLSTHALMRGGVLQLARWGLLDRLIALGTPAVRQVHFHYPHDDITVPVKPSDGVPALYAPRRTVLDPVLVDAAVAAGAEVRYGLSASGLRRDHHGRVNGVALRTTRLRGSTVSARIVIGADGARSTIAAAAEAAAYQRGRVAGAFAYGYWSGVEADGYEWAYRPGIAAGFIPTNGDEVCVFAGGPPARVGRGGHAVLEAMVAEAAPGMAARMARGTPPRIVRTFPGRAGFLRQAWGPGWALVGDAGSWKDPISTHGLTDALRDAELLARAVIVTARQGADEHGAFRAYQAARDLLTLPVLTVADELAGYRWSAADVGPLLRRLSTAMAAEVDAIAAFDAEPGIPLAQRVAAGG